MGGRDPVRVPTRVELGRLREFFLLEKATEKSVRRSELQRTTIREYHEAAICRLAVARDLRGTAQGPVALELYRLGVIFYALAYLSAKDATLEVGALPPDRTLRKLEESLEADGLRSPPEYARIRGLLLLSERLAFDRVAPEQREQKIRELDVTIGWLSGLFDVRSPRELRTARILRLLAAALAGIALLALFLVGLLTPKNLAKGRPVSSNGGTMFGTTMAAAVDGSTSGDYEFHSTPEDSPWLAIDLGRPYDITQVKVFGRGDGTYDQSIPLALEVSDDGSTYREVAQRAEPFSTYDPWVVKPTKVVGQFVRLRTLKRACLVLDEVMVNGKTAK
jgi:hypothetical protein